MSLWEAWHRAGSELTILDPGPHLCRLVLLVGAQTLESDSLRFEPLLCHLTSFVTLSKLFNSLDLSLFIYKIEMMIASMSRLLY